MKFKEIKEKLSHWHLCVFCPPLRLSGIYPYNRASPLMGWMVHLQLNSQASLLMTKNVEVPCLLLVCSRSMCSPAGYVHPVMCAVVVLCIIQPEISARSGYKMQAFLDRTNITPPCFPLQVDIFFTFFLLWIIRSYFKVCWLSWEEMEKTFWTALWDCTKRKTNIKTGFKLAEISEPH